MMLPAIDQVGHWHWWILALVLLIIEMLVPSTVFLWMGIAAGIVGLVLWLIPALGWEYQLLIFAIFSLASIVMWINFFKNKAATADQSTLNRRGQQYLGRILTLEHPIVNGRGSAHLDDTVWRVSGPDLPARQKVTVTGIEGTTLLVDKVPGVSASSTSSGS